MIPKSISASALLNYTCPSRFYAENVLRADSSSNSAADLGTALHAVLERWVKEGYYLQPNADFDIMKGMYIEEFFKLFDDTERYQEGLELAEKWYNRQDWDDRTVISTEKKLSFMLPVKLPDGSDHEFTFNYIMDRFDMRSDGYPEVVDYKSIREPIRPEDLKHKLQARCYAVAAQLEYPHADRIWVTFDLLRYGPVGVAFTKEENRLTYMHLRGLAQRIADDEPTGEEGEVWPKEIINETCRYCIRSHECQALLKNREAGGIESLDLIAEPQKVTEIVDHRTRAKHQMDALKGVVDKLDNLLVDYMQNEEIREVEGDESTLTIQSRNVTRPDGPMIRQIVGNDVWADYTGLTAKAANDILKDPRLTDAQKSLIKQHLPKVPGTRYLKSKTKIQDLGD